MPTSSQQVFETVVKPMMGLYAPPRSLEDKEAAIALYLAALTPYPLEALQGAWIALVSAHEKASWPLPSEIIKATQNWIHKNVKVDPAAPARVDGHHDRRKFTHLCPDWMRSELGQQALKEGWARILWDEIEIKGQLEKSAAWMRDLDRDMREKIADMQAHPSQWIPQVTNMGLNRLAKEADLMREYLA